MKAAIGQLHLCWEDRQANLEKVKMCLETLKEEKAELLLLPEMSLTGFSMHTERTREKDRTTVEQMQSLAAEYRTAVGVGWVKDAGARCENHYSIVTPEGEILDYAKLHPFRYGGEAERFQGGDTLPVCEYRDFVLGVQICYDLRFPEPFQILSREAELILVPANWPAARSEHWKCLLKARAIENMVYVAGINCAGEIGGLDYSGDSGIYGPDGRELEYRTFCLTEQEPEERIQVYEFDNDVAGYQKSFPVKSDRREDLYKKLQEELKRK